MSATYEYSDDGLTNQVAGLNTAHAAGAIVILCVVALWAIRRGFRGASFGGVSVGVR